MMKRILKEWVLPTVLVAVLVAFSYKTAHSDELDEEFVKAPARQTEDAMPPVSLTEWKNKKYEPVEVEEIPELTFKKPEAE